MTSKRELKFIEKKHLRAFITMFTIEFHIWLTSLCSSSYAFIRDKLIWKSFKYIFVGYCNQTKGYSLMDPACPTKYFTARKRKETQLL